MNILAPRPANGYLTDSSHKSSWSCDHGYRAIDGTCVAIPTTGDLAGRVIANELVAGIAAQLLESSGGQSAIHERGLEICPFNFNEERDVENLSKPLRFDPRCRGKLLGQLSATLVDAFDSLLGAFDTNTN